MSNQVFTRNGKAAVFDPVRQVLVLQTPEENVRQAFFTRLIKLGYPKENIKFEFPISRLVPKAKGRLDIVVFANPETPLIIFELKHSEKILTDSVLEQVQEYNRNVQARYVAVSNGSEIRYYQHQNGKYKYISNEPNFKELIEESNLRYDHLSFNLTPLFPAIFADAGYAKKLIADGIIGVDTPQEIRPHIADFDNFLTTSRKLAELPLRDSRLEIIDDLHISAREYGNVSGGSYTGVFRGFLVRDLSGEAQIYRIAIMANARTENDPRIGTRRGTTALLVSVDDYDYSVHNSLQMSIDDSVSIDSGQIHYYHNGSMTVGNKGAVKRDVILSHLTEHFPAELPVTDRGVFLGSLPLGGKIDWPEAKAFIIRLILYANVRDLLRKQISQQ